MPRLSKYLVAGLFALSCTLATAQTNYKDIEVGTVLQTGIGLGTFTKPLPLPEGEWLVINKRVDTVNLTGGAVSSAPRIVLTLKNKQPTSVLFAMVMSFTPDSININWGNNKCELSASKAFADDFGYNPNAMLYVCAKASTFDKFKNALATIPENNNRWLKSNLTALSAYVDEVPDNALFVDVYGNRFGGKSISYTFLLKREGEINADAAYTQFIKEWTHGAGKTLEKVLDNSVTTLALPAAYVSK